jgi:hypothetical protein
LLANLIINDLLNVWSFQGGGNGSTCPSIGAINSVISCVSQIRVEKEGSNSGENRKEAAGYRDQIF